MRYQFQKKIIIALGGSVVFPDQINWQFLAQFKALVVKHLDIYQFVIVVGGGRLSRIYQEAASHITAVTDEDQDWLGIHATRSNAQLLRTIFREVADPVVFDARHKLKKLTHPVTIASGWRPGWSTDYIAVALAQDFRVPEIVIAGRPSHVFTKDHTKHTDAQPLTALSWQTYRTLIPAKWQPGAHAPVDPVAALLGQEAGIKALIIGGDNLKNFQSLLTGKTFTGTLIS